MNYLSLYYKNLAEQLQQKVNHLTQLIETGNRPYADRSKTEEDQYIEDQENIQNDKVKNATKQEQSDRLSDDILKGSVFAPAATTGLGTVGLIGLTGLETALEGSASTEPLAVGGAKALGAGGAGSTNTTAPAGTVNTGGGGGGTGNSSTAGGAGGSGIVIIRYAM